jgi:hypothetical protein
MTFLGMISIGNRSAGTMYIRFCCHIGFSYSFYIAYVIFHGIKLLLHISQEGKIKLILRSVKHHDLKTQRGVVVKMHVVLTSSYDGNVWPASRPAALIPGKSPSNPIG